MMPIPGNVQESVSLLFKRLKILETHSHGMYVTRPDEEIPTITGSDTNAILKEVLGILDRAGLLDDQSTI